MSDFALIETPQLKEALGSFDGSRKNFLCMVAIGSDDVEARRLTGIAESTLREWKKNELFLNIYNLVKVGDYRTVAIDLWLDNQLPIILGELMRIISSGSDGERAHKDKERAIEFYLKDLCGYSRHVDKTLSLAVMLKNLGGESIKEEGG